MKTNVALIGFMGAGKTAVAKLLAEKLNKKQKDLLKEFAKTYKGKGLFKNVFR